jgi:hypothetical protein
MLLIAFPRQQALHESALMLHYTCIVSIVFVVTLFDCHYFILQGLMLCLSNVLVSVTLTR